MEIGFAAIANARRAEMASTPPDALKAEIDAQSGRFEFLKQSLTLGLAGIAGTAALFTDTSKLPATLWSVITIGFFGVALVLVVGGGAVRAFRLC